MSRSEWDKKKGDVKEYEGPRRWDKWEADLVGPVEVLKIQKILDAMESLMVIFFNYDGSDRVVAPFVMGASSTNNPLLRGYQLEGVSRSGKGPGWRVFQVWKMENLENYNEYFEPDDFDFQEFYPWIYRVLKML